MQEKKTFCLVEETIFTHHRLLSFILMLNAIEKNANCVIVCHKQTRDFISKFPMKLNLKLYFITITGKEWNFVHIFKYMLKTIKFCIKKFGHCIFLRDTLTLIRKIDIPENIKHQGYGFHKRIYKSHIPETNKQSYNFEILYVNNSNFVNQIESLLEIPDFHKKSRFTKKINELFNKNVQNIEYNFCVKYNTKYVFSPETLIATEDFFSFDEVLQINDITENLEWNNLKITALAIRMEKPRPQIKHINQQLLGLLLKYDNFYNNILHLSNIHTKVRFVLPLKESIGIWDRNKYGSGLYELIEIFESLYPKYFSLNSIPCKYFAVNKTAIIDKPNDYYLSEELYGYYSVITTDYCGKQIKTLRNDSKIDNFQFGFYFFENPKWLDDYFCEHKELLYTFERNIEFCTVCQERNLNNSIFINGEVKTNDEIVDILTDVKFVLLKEFNCNLMVLCFALGCVPVFESLDVKPFEVTCDTHFCFVEIPEKDQRESIYEKMRTNILSYYEQEISPKNVIKKLTNYLFIRNIE